MLRRFVVAPRIPDSLKRVREIAYNIWWCWDKEAIELFRRLDRILWEQCYQNPVRMLGCLSQERYEFLANDESYLSHMERVGAKLDAYLKAHTWFGEQSCPIKTFRIAYFSAEFGLTDSLPIYSGGLGILAGDHLKSASDLGIPLVGVGLLYRLGYFRQYLSVDGWQQELYPENDFYNMPVELERDDKGNPLRISVEYPQGEVKAQVWRVNVGRVKLYLLDTNIEENAPESRPITGQLYVADQDMRIRQEIMLGVGGVRALRALGISPMVYHMNDTHPAFLAIERLREVIADHKMTFAEALEVVAAGTVFTTHTPVPAGNETFPPEMIDRYLSNFYPQLNLTKEKFLGLGRIDPSNRSEPFGMTVMALRLSGRHNGVSRLHGEVARGMWNPLWKDVPQAEIPIMHITNGVHINTWISNDLVGLYDRYIGPRWTLTPADQSIWKRVDQIPDAELWRTHVRRRERLVAFARRRLRTQLTKRGAPRAEIEQSDEILDPEALTIGFARRFATYKRATLLFTDLNRLKRILSNPERPVQIIYAGKAHPADNAGKDLIRHVIQQARTEDLRRKIVFLEDYDVKVARYLVQGVDVWLNTPLRPMEASGTSGMKAAVNGALNMSIPDGWWPEAFDGTNGWSIGQGEDYADRNYQDQIESQAIYDMLEKEIVPMFYDRGPDKIPREWLKAMKSNLRTICPMFNTNRMLKEYMERSYLPSAARWAHLTVDDMARAKALAAWKQKVNSEWKNLKVLHVETDMPENVEVNVSFVVSTEVQLGGLAPKDVAVELYFGPLDSQGNIASAEVAPMTLQHTLGAGRYKFSTVVSCSTSGQHGYTVRIRPSHEDFSNQHETGLLCWY
ncbi:MAG TPA: alpha-glucan family phosphorylase [bacterium]|nr:alpha-glucan family phosphorylase [bacterium]HQO33775.1 alpha-glucan family phosphorylase [bacterium]